MKWLIVVLALFLLTGSAQAATYDCYNCTDCTNKIGIASDGDTVRLMQNIFSNNTETCINFNDQDNIILDCQNHSVVGNSSIYGIYLNSNYTNPDNSDNNTIKNCIVERFNYSIIIKNSTNNTITDSFIFDNSKGVYLSKSDYTTLKNIIIWQNDDGIYLGNSNHSIITDMNISNNNVGIKIYDSKNNTVSSSYILYNINYSLIISNPEGSRNNTFFNNYINDSTGYGVYISTGDLVNQFNATNQTGPNILGGPYIGGNYWTCYNGSGFSDTCIDSDSDGFCDSPRGPFATGIYDYLPLAYVNQSNETEESCIENWTYGEWSGCINGIMVRSATDLNNCGTKDNRSNITQACTVYIPPSSHGAGSANNTMNESVDKNTTEVKKWVQITVNQTAVFEVNRTDIEVERITIRVNATVIGAELRVRKIETKPPELPEPPRRYVYTYVEINRSMIEEEEINSTTITFRVNKTWLEQNDLNRSTVTLSRYNTTWKDLNTTLVDERLTYLVYEAESPGFSIFAVTALPNTYFQEPYCTANETRCYRDFLQECTGDDWVPVEKCEYGCLLGKCLDPYGYYVWWAVRIVIMAGVIVAVYLIWKNRHKLSRPRSSLSGAELYDKVGRIAKQINPRKEKPKDD